MEKNKQLQLDSSITAFFIEGDFNGMLRYITNSGSLSISLAAKYLNCSRRSIRRYLSGERKIPIGLVKELVENINISSEYILQVMADDTQTYCRSFIPDKNEDGELIWYGDEHVLINTIFYYHCKENISIFELAYRLKINPDLLSEYESGKRTIPQTDVHKICKGLDISIQYLFPQLYSYDGGKTYLPLGLHKVSEETDFLDLYNTPDGYGVSIIQPWPIYRYKHGQPTISVMPDELTMDEFYNTDELFFMKPDYESFYSPAPFLLETLPPNYFRTHSLLLEKDRDDNVKSQISYSPPKPVKRIEVLEPYQICFYWGRKKEILDMAPYVNSASPWYRMLSNYEYFKLARLEYADSKRPGTQCVFWPDGQYIRLMDLVLDQHPYNKNFHYAVVSINSVGDIDNWLQW